MKQQEKAFYVTLGKILKNKRKVAGLSLDYVGKNLFDGMGRSNISAMERGKINISVFQLYSFDLLYGGVLEDILKFQPDESLKKMEANEEIMQQIKKLQSQLK